MADALTGEAAEPAWPEPRGRPLVLLLDASGAAEQRLLAGWVRRHRPPGSQARSVAIPPSRRPRRHRRRAPAALRRVLDWGADPLLCPLRVVWLPKRRHGRHTVHLIDLLTLGDPRDPGPLRRAWILRFAPDRAVVVAGDPAPVSDLRRCWLEARARNPEGLSAFAEFVVLQAGLALERAERGVRGDRYKVPRFLKEDLLGRASFQVGLVRLADRSGVEMGLLVRRARRILEEIAATHSTYVIDLLAALIRLLYTQGYHRRIVYDRAYLAHLASLGRQHPLVFLPAHRSNLDHLVLAHVLFESGLPPNHTAGGVNMNFFPVGPLVRRAGVFFIRRSFKDDEVYKYVLKRYLDHLLSRRFPLEWFLEGGRSRSGKLREPRFGLLAYVVDSYRRGSCDDLVLIPVSIVYDQVQDMEAYLAEHRGEAKEREGFSWLVRAVRAMRRRYGRITLRCGEPLLVSERLAPYGPGTPPEPDAEALEVQRLAFEVGVRIDRATPITPISLITLALLGAGEKSVTVEEAPAALADFLEYVERRGLPLTEPISLGTPERVQAALEALVEHRVVTRRGRGSRAGYQVEAGRHPAVAFYRNTIIHFFLAGAIAELALLRAAEGEGTPTDVFWDEVWALRDLLEFEFYFPARHEFATEVAAEVARARPDWVEALSAGGRSAEAVAASLRPHLAHRVLRPFLEAYLVAAEVLEAAGCGPAQERRAFLRECLARGRRDLEQGSIRCAEAVSAVLFETAHRLLANRGLLEGRGPEQGARRAAFAAQVGEVLARVEAVQAMDTRAGGPGAAQ